MAEDRSALRHRRRWRRAGLTSSGSGRHWNRVAWYEREDHVLELAAMNAGYHGPGVEKARGLRRQLVIARWEVDPEPSAATGVDERNETSGRWP